MVKYRLGHQANNSLYVSILAPPTYGYQVNCVTKVTMLAVSVTLYIYVIQAVKVMLYYN